MWTHSGAPEAAGRIVLGGGLIGLLVLIENYRVLADAALMRDE